MPRPSHFSEDWLSYLDSNKHMINLWCRKGRRDDEAFCSLCQTYFSCGNRGKDQLIAHSATKKHSTKAIPAFSKQQSKFLVSNVGSSSVVSLNKENCMYSISKKDQATRAEILWAFKMADSNFSFASCEQLQELFILMFGEVAKDFVLDRTKASYLIAYGLGPYITKELTTCLRQTNLCYTVAIDETTTAQTKKQLDLYIRFWNNISQQVECRYLSSVFLGHAEAERMKEEICTCLESEGLDIAKIIMISMDGPNVNKSLWKKMDALVQANGSPGLINIGSCNLHIVHNAFRSGFQDSQFNFVEDYADDVYKWFKHSAARREDCKEAQKVMEVEEKYFLNYISCRWLSISPVLKRLVEQHIALEHYFLTFLPRNCKTVSHNSRYQRIISALKNKILLPLMQFLTSVSDIFVMFLNTFQNESPMVHVLYNELSELLKKVLRKFVRPEIIKEFSDNLCSIELSEENMLPSHEIEIGHEAKKSLSSTKLTDRDRFLFFRAALCFYKRVTKKLFITLPLSNRILKNLQCLHPLMRKEKQSVNHFRYVVTKLSHTLLDSERDTALDEWKCYQNDDEIEDDWFVAEKGEQEIKYQRIDYYWAKVINIKRMDGKLRYPVLSKVVKCALILAHGNSDVERGFSLNKAIVTSERSALHQRTIIGLRVVKDYIKASKGITNIKIKKEMIDAARQSCAKYKQALAEESETEKTKEYNKKAKKINKIELKKELEAAEKLLDEGKARLNTALKRKQLADASVATDIIDVSTKKIKNIHEQLEKL